MAKKKLPFLLFLGFEGCLGFIILKKLAPVAIKTGSFVKLAGAVVAATPWSLLAGGTYLAYRKISQQFQRESISR